MTTAFEVFKVLTRKFICFPWADGVYVIQDDGTAFGTWGSRGDFERALRKSTDDSLLIVGCARLSMRVEAATAATA